MKSNDQDEILNKACDLVGHALGTDLAKVMKLLPDGQTFEIRAGVGWNPGIVEGTIVTAAENSPKGLTLVEGAVIFADVKGKRGSHITNFKTSIGVKALVDVLILGGNERRLRGPSSG